MTTDFKRPKLTVLGGRSDIGLACAHAFAASGYDVVLAARNSGDLDAARRDMVLRHGGSVELRDFDALDVAGHEGFVAGDDLPDVVICAVGVLGDQVEDQGDLAAAVQVMRANFEGPASILGAYANAMEARGAGTIVGIGSVAGDRGRASNYIYGSAKAGFAAYLSGLRNRLAKSGVHVATVKPGFVATRMTEGMDLPGVLTAQPEEVAAAVLKAVSKSRNTIYVRPVWWVIMAIIRAIPEMVFKRLSI